MVSDAEFEETEFYRNWCRLLDVFFVVGAVFPSGPNELGVLGIHRPQSAGAYDEEDKARVARFMPHLQRALRVRAQLQQESVYRHTTFEGLDRSETAVLLIAADGRVLYANPLADALLVAGKALCYRNGRLAGVRDAENARLHALIGEATRMGDGRPCDGIMTLQRLNQRPLSVLVAPFRTTLAGYPAAGAIVLIRDPDRSISAIAALRTLFRFTPTEARIAQALANGKTLAQIAAAHRATLQTVRKQLKIILAKTGTNRQAQCVGVILRSVATLARE